jgi:hypothetical protein
MVAIILASSTELRNKIEKSGNSFSTQEYKKPQKSQLQLVPLGFGPIHDLAVAVLGEISICLSKLRRA